MEICLLLDMVGTFTNLLIKYLFLVFFFFLIFASPA